MPTSRLYPEIYYTKLMLKKTLESRDILLYIDCHGHSRKKNAFMYGCARKGADRLKEKVFPLMFDKSHDSFSFNDSNFNVNKEKESTARVVVCKEYRIVNSYTLEVSFCGPEDGLYRDCHFTPT